MSLITLRTLLDHAAEHQYGVPAFNFCNLEQLLSILQAASEENSPVILQVSAGGRKYGNESMVRAMVKTAVALYPQLPIVWHQDHGYTEKECFRSIQMGYTSVMMDGSLTADGVANSLEDNISITKRVVEVARRVGVSVEGEIGCLGRIESSDEVKTQYLTGVDEAKYFMDETKVDALAIAIGTSHGAYKFSKKPTDDVLAMSRLKAIHEALPDVHFVLHGSSSVPQEFLDIIRNYGGEVPETYGVPVESMVEAVKLGVRKFNIDTDLRIVSTAVMREALVKDKTILDPRIVNKKMMAAVTTLVRQRYQKLGSSNRAADLMNQISKTCIS